MAIDFEPFRKLAPERRMQELQKLVDSLKKEIDERQSDIREAEHLLALADEETRLLEQVEVPEARTAPKRQRATKIEEVGIEEKAEEKKERRLTREEQTELEKLLATAPPRSPELLHQMAHRSLAEMYAEEKKIYERQKETGIETQQDREMIYAIRRSVEIKKEEGYKPAGTAKHLMTAVEQMAESMYQGGAGTYKRNPT